MLRELADDAVVEEALPDVDWTPHAQPLKLLAALHYLVQEGRASWDHAPAALREHAEFVRRYMADQSLQTNEVMRCWVLLPCFLEAARRAGVEQLDLIELGPSAGLNLVWDRYRYLYRHGVWGPDEAILELRGEERTPVPAPLLELTPRVRSRTGIDVAPIDVTTDEGARVLKSFVWADQAWRLELLDRAIAAVRADPPEIIRGDVVDELPRLLARRRDDALTIVWQTAVLGYLPPERRPLVEEALERAGRDRPLAYVEAGRPRHDEHRYWGMFVRLWPDGACHLVAHADFHGAWLEWLT